MYVCMYDPYTMNWNSLQYSLNCTQVELYFSNCSHWGKKRSFFSVCFVLHPCNQLNTSLALLILFLDNENDHTRKGNVFFDILCSWGMKYARLSWNSFIHKDSNYDFLPFYRIEMGLEVILRNSNCCTDCIMIWVIWWVSVDRRSNDRSLARSEVKVVKVPPFNMSWLIDMLSVPFI